MAPNSVTAQRSSIQTHPLSRSNRTMPPILVVFDVVDTTPLPLPNSTSSPLLELRGSHHPQQLFLEHLSLPRRRLHGRYDTQDAAATQYRRNFGLLCGRGSEVDRRDLDFASREGNDIEGCHRCRAEPADQSFLQSRSYITKPPFAPDPATSHEPKPAEMKVPWCSTDQEGGSRRTTIIDHPAIESNDPKWPATNTTTPRRTQREPT